MAKLDLSQQKYNEVVRVKKLNEDYINELYATMNNFTFREKIAATQIIEYLKQNNLEYEKYIIIYQRKNDKKETKQEYTVIQGDTLPRIAYKITGDISNWQEIYNYNQLTDIKLTPGDVLKIPQGL